MSDRPSIYRGTMVKGSTRKLRQAKLDENGQVKPESWLIQTGMNSWSDESGKFGSRNAPQHHLNLYLTRAPGSNTPRYSGVYKDASGVPWQKGKRRAKKMRIPKDNIGSRYSSAPGLEVKNAKIAGMHSQFRHMREKVEAYARNQGHLGFLSVLKLLTKDLGAFLDIYRGMIIAEFDVRPKHEKIKAISERDLIIMRMRRYHSSALGMLED